MCIGPTQSTHRETTHPPNHPTNHSPQSPQFHPPTHSPLKMLLPLGCVVLRTAASPRAPAAGVVLPPFRFLAVYVVCVCGCVWRGGVLRKEGRKEGRQTHTDTHIHTRLFQPCAGGGCHTTFLPPFPLPSLSLPSNPRQTDTRHRHKPRHTDAGRLDPNPPQPNPHPNPTHISQLTRDSGGEEEGRQQRTRGAEGRHGSVLVGFSCFCVLSTALVCCRCRVGGSSVACGVGGGGACVCACVCGGSRWVCESAAVRVGGWAVLWAHTSARQAPIRAAQRTHMLVLPPRRLSHAAPSIDRPIQARNRSIDRSTERLPNAG
jgi:hypothetical protein